MRISSQSVGLFLQSVGFPFDIQGPGSSRNVFIHFLHKKSIEDGNQTCSPPFFIRTCGKNDVLGSNVKHLVGVLDG